MQIYEENLNEQFIEELKFSFKFMVWIITTTSTNRRFYQLIAEVVATFVIPYVGLFCQRWVVFRVAEHLVDISFRVIHFDIGYVAVFIKYGCVNRIDESLVRSDVEFLLSN